MDLGIFKKGELVLLEARLESWAKKEEERMRQNGEWEAHLAGPKANSEGASTEGFGQPDASEGETEKGKGSGENGNAEGTGGSKSERRQT